MQTDNVDMATIAEILFKLMDDRDLALDITTNMPTIRRGEAVDVRFRISKPFSSWWTVTKYTSDYDTQEDTDNNSALFGFLNILVARGLIKSIAVVSTAKKDTEPSDNPDTIANTTESNENK